MDPQGCINSGEAGGSEVQSYKNFEVRLTDLILYLKNKIKFSFLPFQMTSLCFLYFLINLLLWSVVLEGSLTA